MELVQIRYFLEVAKTKHITNSAKNLHITQPALSQAIKRLEKTLGVPLFVSKGRNIMLTEYGLYMQKKLEPLMEELDHLPAKLKFMEKLENDTIHINVLAASELVMDAIIEFKKTHLGLHFQMLQNMENELYDIAVTTSLEPAKNQEKHCFTCKEEIFLAVPKEGCFQGQTTVSLRQVEEEEFISLQGSREFRAICDQFCRYAGFQPNIIFESDNPAAVKNMIGANMGIGFWPEFSWGELKNDQVQLLRIQEPRFERNITINYHQNKSDSRQVVEFYEFLVAFFQSRKQKKK